MQTFDTFFGNIDISSKHKRKHVISLIVAELALIRMEEELCQEASLAPVKMREGHTPEEWSVKMLTDAMVTLMDAY